MAEKCVWCAGRTKDLRQVEVESMGKTEQVRVCTDDCEGKLRDFLQYADGHVAHFLIGLIGLPVIGLIVTFAMMNVDRGGLGLFIIGAGMGAVIIKYPFVTPQTVQWLGLQKGIAVARVIGVMCIAGGIAGWLGLALS